MSPVRVLLICINKTNEVFDLLCVCSYLLCLVLRGRGRGRACVTSRMYTHYYSQPGRGVKVEGPDTRTRVVLIHSSPPRLSPALTELLNCHSLLIYIPPPAHFHLWLSLKLYSVLKSISLIFNSSLFIRIHKSSSRRTISCCLTATITNLKVSPFCFFD